MKTRIQCTRVELEVSGVEIFSSKVQLGLKFRQEVQAGDTDLEVSGKGRSHREGPKRVLNK